MKFVIIFACLIALAIAVEPEQDQEASPGTSNRYGGGGGYRSSGGYGGRGGRPGRSVQDSNVDDQEANEGHSSRYYGGGYGGYQQQRAYQYARNNGHGSYTGHSGGVRYNSGRWGGLGYGG